MKEHLCLILGVLVLVNAEKIVIDSRYKCGNKYKLDNVESVTIRYEGGSVETNHCETEFTIEDVVDHEICVQPILLNLDCSTRIEYQEHVVANSFNEGELTCDMNHHGTFDETCAEYVSEFFIVIKKKKSFETSNEIAEIRVFAKSSSFGSTGLVGIIAAVIIIPVIGVFICVFFYKWQQTRRLQQLRNSQVNYTTTTGPTSMQTGGPPQYPGYTSGVASSQQAMLPQSGYPQSGYPQSGYPQSAVPGNPVQQSAGGYYVHPTVTAYPTQNPAPPGPYNYQHVPQQQVTPASAPPRDIVSEPPPSYESLMNK